MNDGAAGPIERSEALPSADSRSDRLRIQAEARLREKQRRLQMPGAKDLESVIHDLHVHQVELEIQNEELRTTQKALEISRDRFMQLYNHAPVGYLTLDANGMVVQANHTFSEMVGRSSADILNRPFMDFIHEQDRGVFLARFRAFMKRPEDKRIETRLQSAGSRPFFARVEGRIVDFPGSGAEKEEQRRRTLVTVSDISDRKAAEQALRQNERRLSEVVQGSAVAALVIDYEHRITHWNRICEKMTGIGAADILGTRSGWKGFYSERRPLLADLVLDEAPEEEIRRLYGDRVRRSPLVEDAYEVEQFFENLGGRPRWLIFTAAPLTDAAGRAVGAIETFQDVTGLKNLEAQLRHSHKMEAVGTLAGGIAHEFNNILGLIVGHAELGMEDLAAASPLYGHLEEIHCAGLRARDVVQRLLNFSRKNDHVKKTIRLQKIVEDSLRLLAPSIPPSVIVDLTIPGDVPPVLADPTQIQQVIINLGTNAVHAMEKEGGRLRLRLETVSDGPDRPSAGGKERADRVRLTVEDTGCGIAAENLGRVFDPYFTTKEVGRGTGMGLAAVHGIVESHGGTVRAESTCGKGSRFTVELPAARAQERPRAESTPQPAPAKGNEHILLVDDEASLVQMGRLSLERLGYTVEGETNPVDALALFKQRPESFDLVITDLSMPRMAGDRLCREVKKIRPGIPVILCTGYNQAPEQNCRSSLFLQKPYVVRTLAETVRKALQRNSSP